MPTDTEPKKREWLSAAKQAWWEAPWPHSKLKNPRFALVITLAVQNPRPTNQDESILAGYCRMGILHDREPELLLNQLLQNDPDFFAGFPAQTVLTRPRLRAEIGLALKSYARLGLNGYEKPNLRKKKRKPAPQQEVQGQLPLKGII